MPHAFSRRLGEGPILCDGAMGTVGANRFKLAAHGLGGRVHAINRAGVKLARDVRESSGRDVFVLGSIGPSGKCLEPLGHEVRRRDAGAYLIPSFGRFEIVAEVLDAIH